MLNLVGLSAYSGLDATSPILAQATYEDAGIGIFQIILYIIFYVVFAFLLQKILEKCRVDNTWFAWIPILNAYKIFEAGDNDNPILWTILLLIPCVNIVAVIFSIIAWVKICQKLGKSPWLLLLFLIPGLGGLIFLGILAFG
ncbi:MAG: DUF5684 domain-containing protein [Thainema sp.]